MNLEDTHADILQKACGGLGIDRAALARKTGLTSAALEPAFGPKPNPATLRLLAVALGLVPDRLEAIAKGTYAPEAGQIPRGVLQFTTPFRDMTVNSYLVWDGQSGKAAAFDTGADCSGMLEEIAARNLRLESVFLTHSHIDHVCDLPRLVERTGARAWSCEPVRGAETFAPGHPFSLGDLKISTGLTCGHSPAGITYVVRGLGRPVAIVGDALFAGSMGGGKVSYADALRTTRAEILSLPLDTLLGPGHGPWTTVAQEIAHNPFFP